MKIIQKLKCKIGWHKWFYGYLNVPELGFVAMRTCSHRCWKVEIINSVTGSWDQIKSNKDTGLWERI